MPNHSSYDVFDFEPLGHTTQGAARHRGNRRKVPRSKGDRKRASEIDAE